ncbi:MAG TPA: CDP-alcohol phosphatidyltransferase family protein [Polyangiaceae bacterium]
MSSIQNTSRLFEPLSGAPSLSRLNGTLWAKSIIARAFYRCVEVSARLLARMGISADAITYASLVLAVLAGIAVGIGHPGIGALLVLLSGSLDLLDGAVARTTGSASRWGALLDSTLDRVADAAPLAGVVVYYAHLPWAATPALLTLIAGFVISYVRARAEALGIQLPSLFMRRAERVLLVAGSLALGVISFEAGVTSPLMLAGVALTGLLSLIGAFSILNAAHSAMKSNAT